MSRYKVEKQLLDGYEVLILKDQKSAAIAKIIPSIGNNLYHFEVNGNQIIQGPNRVSDLSFDNNWYKFGIPILFPPNRIAGGCFNFAGNQYELPLNEPNNHIHGELCNHAWEISDVLVDDENGVSASSVFNLVDHPDIVKYFPHELQFRVTYTLFDGKLTSVYKISNGGNEEAPFAFGLHPYFSLPELPDSNILIEIPSSVEWPVDSNSFVLGLGKETPFIHRLNLGALLNEIDDGGCRVVSLLHQNNLIIRNEKNLDPVRITFDEKFRFLVIFRPFGKKMISLEPYTCLTNAFNLPWSYDITGVQGLPTGESIEFIMTISS